MAALSTTLLAIGLTGVGISAVGQWRAGNQARELGEYNAAAAEKQAEDALLRGREDEQRFRQGVKMLIGSQKAGFAGQGVDVSSGSALDVQADAAFLGELDALTIETNAQREAWGYRVQAENYRRGGQMQQQASRFNAAGTVLGNGTSLIAARYGWGRQA